MFRPAAVCSVLLLGLGCAQAPASVRGNPYLSGAFFRHPTQAFLGSPRFFFRIHRAWEGPETIADGVRFTDPKGKASLSVAFHPRDSALWRSPTAYRQYMREQGATEDGHYLLDITVSSRPASLARFTSYGYDPTGLLGERRQLLTTELILVPDPKGIYVIRFEAARRDSRRLRPLFGAFLASLLLSDPESGAEKEKFVVPGQRESRGSGDTQASRLERERGEAQLELARAKRFRAPPGKRWLAGALAGLPAGAGGYFMYAFHANVSAGLYYGQWSYSASYGAGLPAQAFRLQSIGARARWHWSGRAPRGGYLYADIARQQGKFAAPSSTAVSLAREESALFPSTGAGYQTAWGPVSMDMSNGIGPAPRLYGRWRETSGPLAGAVYEASFRMPLTLHFGLAAHF